MSLSTSAQLGTAPPDGTAADPESIVARLKAALPRGWLPDVSPVLDTLMTGCSASFNHVYSLLAYTARQARIMTATDVFLDLAAQDYLGTRLLRKPGQSDDVFRQRIQAEILRPRVTRQALSDALYHLTGVVPRIFEPAWPPDTGGYGFVGMTAGTGLAFASATGTPAGAGGWGSLNIPFQFYITAYSGNVSAGVGGIAGYYTGSGGDFGGWGAASNGGATSGSIQLLADASVSVIVSQDDITNLVASVVPAGSVPWLHIADLAYAPPTPPATSSPFSSFFDSTFGA